MPLLKTTYLGLKLDNPFIVGSSPLAYSISTAEKLEAAGASAIIMHSLFEEQIIRDNICGSSALEDDPPKLFPEAASFPFHPEKYIDHIADLKSHLRIPVIGSINGVHSGTWIEFARQIGRAGADAIELNLNFLPKADLDSSADIENRALNIIKTVRKNTALPISVKLTPFYTGFPRFVHRIEEAGAQAITLFNPFFQPDIDIEEIAYKPQLSHLDCQSLLLRIRWIATLYGRTNLSLSANGGIHSDVDAIKAIMAGAKTIQMVSSLIQKGPKHLASIIESLKKWMEAHDFDSIEQMRGILSFPNLHILRNSPVLDI